MSWQNYLESNGLENNSLIAVWICASSEILEQNLSQLQDLQSDEIVSQFIVASESEAVLKLASESGFSTYQNLSDLKNWHKKLKDLYQGSDHLLFIQKQDEDFKFLDVRPDLDGGYDWARIIRDFTINYLNPNPDDNNYWRWGQIVPTSGEYLCLDCGYIEELEAGSVFPICEVCLAGDVTGPSEYDGSENNGYWELI